MSRQRKAGYMSVLQVYQCHGFEKAKGSDPRLTYVRPDDELRCPCSTNAAAAYNERVCPAQLCY
jgi:hypothetical protein